MDLITIKHLKTYFYQDKGLLSKLFGGGMKTVHAVDDVSFTIQKGRTFGLVGESGCGKSTLGQTLFRLVPAKSGEILFEGEDVLAMGPQTPCPVPQEGPVYFPGPVRLHESQDDRGPDHCRAAAHAGEPRA